MRFYSAYIFRNILYSVSEAFDYYIEYYRTYRRYKLVSPITKIKRLAGKAEALRE
jgi:hypothetical protein